MTDNETRSSKSLVVPLELVVGFGYDAITARDVFRRSEATNDSPENLGSREERHSAEKIAALKCWERWLHKATHAKHICFLDFTFFPNAGDRIAHSLTIVVTQPSDNSSPDENFKSYLDFLKQYFESGHSMALHDVFSRGIPHIANDISNTSISRPRTSIDLSNFRDQKGIASRGLLVGQLKPMVSDIEYPPASLALYADECPTFRDATRSVLSAEAISTTPLDEHWSTFLDTLQKVCEGGKLRSANGCRPGWVAAVPVGLQDSQNSARHAISSCLFIALDDKASEAALFETIRYVILYLYEVNLTTLARQAGREAGLVNAIETFAHQIKGIATAMSDRWSVTSEEWEQMRTVFGGSPAFTQSVAKARVMPVPGLYDAVAKTLRVWAQSERVADLYPESPNWPTDLKVLVNTSWSYAAAVRFTTGSVNESVNRLNSDELDKLWNFETLRDRLDLQGVPAFSLNENAKWSVEDRRTAEKWICAMTRLLASVFDNYFAHGKAESLPRISAKLQNTSILSLTVTNIAEGSTADESRIRLGMTGTDVLRYLGERAGGTVSVPEVKPKAGETYSLKVDVPIPDVLFGTDDKGAEQ